MAHELLDRALGGDIRALSRVISLVEDGDAEGRALFHSLYPRTGRARVLGLTGPPGVGKSTLTDRLTAHFRGLDQKVGVVAVDPSSPFTGGAILGDRIRMTSHFTDPGVFIRSLATRGNLGGLSAATADVVDVLDAAGYDVVLVETIGVGQEDIAVTRIVPTCLLVLTPGLGDGIQIMKSGIMEVGDVYVINKADLEGADRVESALRSALIVAGLEARRPIVRTTAATGEGIAELVRAIDEVEANLSATEREARRIARARDRMASIVHLRLLRAVRRDLASAEEWERLASRIAARESDPYEVAEELIEKAGLA